VPIHFTDVTIRSLKEGVYFDDHTPSFAIRVGKNRKTWFIVKQPNRTKGPFGKYWRTIPVIGRSRLPSGISRPRRSGRVR
jgi:hypothetical protein